MDVELAKTFLEVVNAGSFIKASERLHVTQTAVTARVRSLEQLLDCTLFVRNRAGARLTAQGKSSLPTPRRWCRPGNMPATRCGCPKATKPASTWVAKPACGIRCC